MEIKSEMGQRAHSMLPYYLQNGENIEKVYEAIGRMFDEIIAVTREIIDSRDLDNSTLYGLDVLGNIVGQLRQQMDDDTYRNRIKTRIIENTSKGYIETLNQLGSIFLGDGFKGIREGWNDVSLGNEPAMIAVDLDGNDISANKLVNSIRSLETGTAQVSPNTRLGEQFLVNPETQTTYQYKPIFLPDLKKAVSIGVKLYYHVNNEIETIEITEIPSFSVQRIIQCGTMACSASMGVIL